MHVLCSVFFAGLNFTHGRVGHIIETNDQLPLKLRVTI